MKPSEKRALTIEIKQLQEYINDLVETKERQGDKYHFIFEGRKCDRWMIHGEFFFPSTVTKYQNELKALIRERANAENYPSSIKKSSYETIRR